MRTSDFRELLCLSALLSNKTDKPENDLVYLLNDKEYLLARIFSFSFQWNTGNAVLSLWNILGLTHVTVCGCPKNSSLVLFCCRICLLSMKQVMSRIETWPQLQQGLRDRDQIFQDKACSPPQPDIYRTVFAQDNNACSTNILPPRNSCVHTSWEKPLSFHHNPRDQEKGVVETTQKPGEPERSVEERHHPQRIFSGPTMTNLGLSEKTRSACTV